MSRKPKRKDYEAVTVDVGENAGSDTNDLPSATSAPSLKEMRQGTDDEFPHNWLRELKPIFLGGWALSLNQLCMFLPGIFAVSFLETADELAAASSGFFFANVVGVSLVVGIGIGLTSLASQAFGAGNNTRVGLLLQRQILIHFVVVCVPVALVWWYAESVLIALGQPAAISALTAQFLKWRIPALPFYATQRDIEWMLQCTKSPVLPRTALYFAAALLNIFLFWVLISPQALGLGFIGAPIAVTITNICTCVALAVLAPTLCPQGTWPRAWDIRVACSGWAELLALSVPGTLMLCAEWWGNEMNVFLAGKLCTSEASSFPNVSAPVAGDTEDLSIVTTLSADEVSCLPLDVFPLLLQTMVVVFMVHFGFSLKGGAHVGNLLGANEPKRARTASWVLLAFVASIAAAAAIILLLVRNWWGYVFSDDSQIVDMIAQTMPLVSLQLVAGALGPGALSSIIRGAGVLNAPSVINVTAFWVVGVPLGIFLTFHENWGIFGLWTAIDISAWIMVLGMSLHLFCIVDFEKVASSASLRGRSSSDIDANCVNKQKSAPEVPN